MVGGLSYLCTDGGTIDISVNVVTAFCQTCNLVLVVTDAGTYFPLEVFQGDSLDGSTGIKTIVLQFTVVGPVLIQTTEES